MGPLNTNSLTAAEYAAYSDVSVSTAASASARAYNDCYTISSDYTVTGVVDWYTPSDARQEIRELQREVTELRSLLQLSSEDLAAIRELRQLKELILELGFEKLLMEGAE